MTLCPQKSRLTLGQAREMIGYRAWKKRGTGPWRVYRCEHCSALHVTGQPLRGRKYWRDADLNAGLVPPIKTPCHDDRNPRPRSTTKENRC